MQTLDNRSPLIEAALMFAKTVSTLEGVQRIALVGSIVTPKQNPKDIDLLLTITDDMPLEALALHSRRLRGKMQGFNNHGTDVFLANPQGEYIGRVCTWKRCEPGIRARCFARTCGDRPYLYDDLDDLKLTRELVASPPLEVWPQVVRRVPIPADVESLLVSHL